MLHRLVFQLSHNVAMMMTMVAFLLHSNRKRFINNVTRWFCRLSTRKQPNESRQMDPKKMEKKYQRRNWLLAHQINIKFLTSMKLIDAIVNQLHTIKLNCMCRDEKCWQKRNKNQSLLSTWVRKIQRNHAQKWSQSNENRKSISIFSSSIQFNWTNYVFVAEDTDR